MFLADFHTHTRLSPDSRADPAEMARAARAAGLAALCFTDHLDFLNEEGRFVGLGDAPVPWYPPRERAAMAPPMGLTLYGGVELGEAWEDPALAGQVAGTPGLDFIIGSVHNLDSAHGGADFALFDFTGNEALCQSTLENYFQSMERLVALDCFDVLGHVPYPWRYMVRRDGNRVPMEPWLPRIEGILRTLLASGRAIELNTDRGRMVEEWRPILGLYRDCGGRLLTLGSDGHSPGEVGRGLREAAALAGEYGLEPVAYAHRQPQI